MSDLIGSALTLGVVLVFLVTSEVLSALDIISKENARKLIHISVGNVIFFVPLFETRWLAAMIPGLFVIGNLLLSPVSPIEKLRLRTFEAGHTFGTVLYPLSLSIATYLFFTELWILVAVFFPVVYGDGMAAVVGPRAKTGKFTIMGNEKTLVGTATMALYSWASVFAGIIILGYSINLAILVSSVVAVIAPIVELASPTGTDNLIIPSVLSVFFLLFASNLLAVGLVPVSLYFWGLLLGLVFAFGGLLAGVLTEDGAIVGFMITTVMLGLGGITLGTELLLFFVLGSVATKLVASVVPETQDEFEKGSEKRDAIQALAKAGLPAVMSLLFVFNYSILIFYIATGIMAAALVDTIATEAGIATNGTPVHVLRPWKKAEPGTTGVISLPGTAGGLLAGLFFSFVTFIVHFVDPVPLELRFMPHIFITTGAGLAGMVADSILGSTIQRHNKCVECGKVVEAKTHHDRETIPDQGISWFNNDMTNFVGTAVGGLVALLLAYQILG